MKNSKWKIISTCLLVLALVEGTLIFKTYFPNGSRVASLEFDRNHPFSFHFHHPSSLERLAQDVIGDQANTASLDSTLERDIGSTGAAAEFGTHRIENKGKEVALIFDLKGRQNGDYSVQVKNNEVIFSGKGKESFKKTTSAPWPFHHNKKETDVVKEGSWNQLQVFPVPDGADPQHFKVERNNESLAITFQKIKNSHT